MDWLTMVEMGVMFFAGGMLGLLIAAVLPAQEPLRGAADWNAQEGIFAFLGHLCTQPNRQVGLSADLAPLVEEIRAFAVQHDLPAPREGWERYVHPRPTAQRYTPSDNQTILE